LSERPETRKEIHPVTLNFTDRDLENTYRRDAAGCPRFPARAALGLGLAAYALLGALDPYFIPDAHRSTAWLIRIAALGYGAAVLLFTFHRLFRKLDQVAVALTGPVAAAGLAAVMGLMPTEAVSQYYASLLIVVFWAYLFPGIRFVHGLWANITIIAAFYLASGLFRNVPEPLLAGSAFFLFSASALAGAEAYLRERGARLLFKSARQAGAGIDRPEIRALYDRLTSLPNRDLLADRLDQAIVASRRDGRPCAGFYLDIDDFGKAIESYGRSAGDEMLQIVAQRLRQTMRESDTVARLGEDEFFILARGAGSEDAAETIVARVQSCVDQPVSLSRAKTARLSVSMGICLFPYPYCTPDDIVYRAELALRAAKQAGKHGHAFASPDDSTAERLA
jgi:diguanylate cyclase (GGDEF)-like protein